MQTHPCLSQLNVSLVTPPHFSNGQFSTSDPLCFHFGVLTQVEAQAPILHKRPSGPCRISAPDLPRGPSSLPFFSHLISYVSKILGFLAGFLKLAYSPGGLA